MLLNLDENLIQHLQCFTHLSEIIDNDTLKSLVLEFVSSNLSAKKITSISKKCNIEEDKFTNGIQGLVKVLNECYNNKMKVEDIRTNFAILGMSDEINENIIIPIYESIHEELELSHSARSVESTNSYSDLKYRIDVELCSKLVGDMTRPSIKLQFLTKDEQIKLFETDATNIRHMIAELELAQREINSLHFQKTGALLSTRYVKQ